MSSSFYTPHPEDHELLSYSDGELEGAAARRIRKHLKDCWRCRTTLEDLQATVVDFMRYKEHALEPNLPAPPAPWRNLRPDFDRIDRENAHLSSRSRFLVRFGPLPAPAIGRIAVGLAAVAVISFGLGYVYNRQHTNELPALTTPGAVKTTNTNESPSTSSLPPVRPLPSTREPAAVEPPVETARRANTELEVALALHRANADLGEQVEISRNPNGGIIVTGTALSASRRQELTATLAQIPGVSIRWEDAQLSHNPSRPNANFEAGRLPWQTQLETAFGGKVALERLSNELLDLSDRVAARAQAMQKLNDEFSSASLTAKERGEWNAALDDHRRELRKAAHELARRSSTVFEKLGVAPVESASQALTAAGPVWPAAQQTDQLLNVLFAGAETNRSLGQTVEDLRLAMARLEAAVNR